MLEYVYTVSRLSVTRGQHCNGEFFFRIVHSTAKISSEVLFFAVVLQKALRYWIPRVEIATEMWYKQKHAYTKNKMALR